MNTDIIALARAAKAKGYDDTQKIAKRLEQIVHRNAAYTERRAQRGTHTATDEALCEDNEVLAMAITILESIG